MTATQLLTSIQTDINYHSIITMRLWVGWDLTLHVSMGDQFDWDTAFSKIDRVIRVSSDQQAHGVVQCSHCNVYGGGGTPWMMALKLVYAWLAHVKWLKQRIQLWHKLSHVSLTLCAHNSSLEGPIFMILCFWVALSEPHQKVQFCQNLILDLKLSLSPEMVSDLGTLSWRIYLELYKMLKQQLPNSNYGHTESVSVWMQLTATWIEGRY